MALLTRSGTNDEGAPQSRGEGRAGNASPAVAGPQRAGRALWIDVARGGAIVAMIVYHLAFDLRFFGFVDWPVERHPLWRAFAASIASTFLFIAGVSLVYAHEHGIRWRAFWRRFAILAVCAGLVTVGTMIAVPAPIYFGILHAIATFSVLALPFLRAPIALILGAAALVFFAPTVLTSPFFQAPIFYPLGLAPYVPLTFDYEPIFPWFSVTLLGVATGRLINPPPPVPSPPRPPLALRILVRAGRNSLVIYLVHQPILFGALMLIGIAIPLLLGNGPAR